MTREEAARVMGVTPREVSKVADTEHGVAVVMSSGAHRLIRDDGYYATDDHVANKHLRTFDVPPDTAGEGHDDESEAPELGEVPDGTVERILAWVGDDPNRARAALEIEQAQPVPRKSLVKGLEEVL